MRRRSPSRQLRSFEAAAAAATTRERQATLVLPTSSMSSREGILAKEYRNTSSIPTQKLRSSLRLFRSSPPPPPRPQNRRPNTPLAIPKGSHRLALLSCPPGLGSSCSAVSPGSAQGAVGGGLLLVVGEASEKRAEGEAGLSRERARTKPRPWFLVSRASRAAAPASRHR